MRPGLAKFPQVALPDMQESCDVFADAFVRAVAVPQRQEKQGRCRGVLESRRNGCCSIDEVSRAEPDS
jgi:hypothetical protein